MSEHRHINTARQLERAALMPSRRICAIWVMVVTCSGAHVAHAQDAAQQTEAKQRAPGGPPTHPARGTAPPASARKAAAGTDTGEKPEPDADDDPLTGTFELTPRGIISLQTSWSNQALVPGAFALYVAAPAPHINQFQLSAANTTVGFMVEGVSFGSWKLSGALDLALKAPTLQARTVLAPLFYDVHVGARSKYAFVLIGQFPDILLAFSPATLNGFPGSYLPGFLGFFRPQIRAGGRIPIAPVVDIRVQAAIARDVQNYQVDPLIVGGGGGVPDGQGRISLSAGNRLKRLDQPWRREYELGLAGHYGKRRFAFLNEMGRPLSPIRRTTWSFVGDLRANFPTGTAIRARIWRGQALGDFQAGIFQSVSSDTLDPIHAWGGWFDVRQQLGERWRLAVGYGRDDPRDRVVSIGQRQLNSAWFGNVVWAWSRTVSFGTELSHWKTDWKGLGVADAWRGEFNTSIKF